MEAYSKNGHFKIVAKKIKSATDSEIYASLKTAIKYKRSKVVNVIVKYYKSKNIIKNDILQFPIENKLTKIVELLLKCTKPTYNDIFIACELGHIEILILLMKNIQQNQKEIYDLIFENVFNEKVVITLFKYSNVFPDNPMIAKYLFNDTIIEYFVDNYNKINLKKILFFCCCYNKFKILKKLFNNNSIEFSQNIITIAVNRNYTDIVRFFLTNFTIEKFVIDNMFLNACELGWPKMAKLILENSEPQISQLLIEIAYDHQKVWKVFTNFYGLDSTATRNTVLRLFLPEYKVKKYNKEIHSKDCPICFNNFNFNVIELHGDARHSICDKCYSKIDDKCPLCRVNLF